MCSLSELVFSLGLSLLTCKILDQKRPATPVSSCPLWPSGKASLNNNKGMQIVFDYGLVAELELKWFIWLCVCGCVWVGGCARTCVQMCTPGMTCLWRSEDNLRESIFSFCWSQISLVSPTLCTLESELLVESTFRLPGGMLGLQMCTTPNDFLKN